MTAIGVIETAAWLLLIGVAACGLFKYVVGDYDVVEETEDQYVRRTKAQESWIRRSEIKRAKGRDLTI